MEKSGKRRGSVYHVPAVLVVRADNPEEARRQVLHLLAAVVGPQVRSSAALWEVGAAELQEGGDEASV